MFVRIKASPNSPRRSVQIVESFRQNGSIKQRILRHIGVAENESHLQKLKELAAFTIAQMKGNLQLSLFAADEEAKLLMQNCEDDGAPLSVDLRQLREVSRITVGFHEVYGSVYQQLGFDRLLGSRRVASTRVLRDLVMARLAKPSSKLASAEFLRRDFGLSINVDQIYRMMDHLDESAQTRLQNLARDAAFGLLGSRVDVLFFDCTTLYFESFDEDALRQKGMSKDRKTAETQILLALLVTREGLPVGWRIYPGSQWEGHTLKDALVDIRRICSVERVVLVADAAMLSKDNIAVLNQQKQNYIVAARLRNLPRAVEDEILNRKAYKKLDGEQTYIETIYQGQRLIVTYSPERARKDAHERDRAVQKAGQRYDGKSVKQMAGHLSKYFKVEGKGYLQLDKEKIQADARWDGLHGMVTNMPDLTAQEACAHYHGLWQVEETFRLSKHDLAIRPIFHWTQRRIQAHVSLCFMALTCLRWLTYTCELRYEKLSAEVIQTELAHVQTSILEHKKNHRRFAIPSAPTQHAKQLFKMVGKTLNSTPFEIFP